MFTVTLERGNVAPVKDFAEASRACRQFIETNGLGSSAWAGGTIKDARGKAVAWVSYNGKVWGSKKWSPDATPLFNPYAA